MSEDSTNVNQVTEDAPNGRFKDMLYRTNAKIRKDRADAIIEDAEVLYRREIEDLQRKLNKYKRDRENMLDLSPTDAQSLKLASDFDASGFVEKDIELGVNIRNLEIKIEIARQQYFTLFGKSA